MASLLVDEMAVFAAAATTEKLSILARRLGLE